ncbi:MAG: hypothetical protein ACE5G2_08185 [Candidatus Krumholzibacteriia bacterium]
MKVEVTIRCVRCHNVEKVITESWSLLKTTCGCEGPYRVLERRQLPEEEGRSGAKSAASRRTAG